MPVIEVAWLAGRTAEQKRQLAARITDAVVDVTGLRPDAVWVVFRDVAPEDWRVGGRPATPG